MDMLGLNFELGLYAFRLFVLFVDLIVNTTGLIRGTDPKRSQLYGKLNTA